MKSEFHEEDKRSPFLSFVGTSPIRNFRKKGRKFTNEMTSWEPIHVSALLQYITSATDADGDRYRASFAHWGMLDKLESIKHDLDAAPLVAEFPFEVKPSICRKSLDDTSSSPSLVLDMGAAGFMIDTLTSLHYIALTGMRTNVSIKLDVSAITPCVCGSSAVLRSTMRFIGDEIQHLEGMIVTSNNTASSTESNKENVHFTAIHIRSRGAKSSGPEKQSTKRKKEASSSKL